MAEKTGEEFKAEVELQFANLEALMGQLSSAMENALSAGFKPTEKLEKQMDAALLRGMDLAAVMENASTEADFAEAQAAMTFISHEAQKIANTLGSQKNLDLIDAGQIRQAAREMGIFKRATEAAQHATIKTSLASQNVLRIIQDLPYGMFGVANNIEQLAESFGSLRAQGLTVGQSIKAAFMPLVSGPMAIPFVISLMTMFILSWDKLKGAIDGAAVSLGLMTDAQRDYNEARAKMEKGGVEALVNEIEDDDVALMLFEAEGRLEEYMDAVEAAQKKVNSLKKAGVGDPIKIISPYGGGGGELSRSSFGIAPPEDQQAFDKAQAELDELIKRRNDSIEAIKRLRGREQILFEEDQRRRALGFIKPNEGTDIDEEKEKKAKAVRAFEFTIEQIRIDAMQEGLEKTLAQLTLNAREERAQMIKDYGARADLIEGLEKKDRAQRGAAVQKWMDEQTELHKKAQEQIAEAEKEAREKALKERQEAIKQASDISLFNIQGQLFAALAEIDRNDPYKAERTQLMADLESDLQKISTRRQEIAAQLDAGLMDQKIANAELATLLNEEVLLRKRAADQIKDIEEEKRNVVMGVFGQMAGDMSDFFGSMNFLAQKEGKNGLEQTKKYLFAQAVAEAIAAGISATQSIMSMPGVAPGVKIAAAITAGAAITARLMAAAKRINSISLNGANSAGSVSGGFVALNTSVTGNRVAAFERQRALDSGAFGGDTGKKLDVLADKLDTVAGRIQHQRVMLDDRTSGKIVEKGAYFNRRTTGKIDNGV